MAKIEFDLKFSEDGHATIDVKMDGAQTKESHPGPRSQFPPYIDALRLMQMQARIGVIANTQTDGSTTPLPQTGMGRGMPCIVWPDPLNGDFVLVNVKGGVYSVPRVDVLIKGLDDWGYLPEGDGMTFTNMESNAGDKDPWGGGDV